MTALAAVIGYALWTLLPAVLAVSWRIICILRGQPADSWPRGAAGQSRPALIKRAEDAHANCVENLPVFAAVVLAGVLLGKGAMIDTLATWVLYARIAQTLSHLAGVNHWLVMIRATFYFAQIGLIVYMSARLLGWLA
jgi:uncharacterized MAPEG superfamily protein